MANNKKYTKQELQNMSTEELQRLKNELLREQQPNNNSGNRDYEFCNLDYYEQGGQFLQEFFNDCNLYCDEEGYQQMDIAPPGGDGLINVVDIVQYVNYIQL